MNVFPLHLDKQKSAAMNVDNHLHKIILESMQMISHIAYKQNIYAPYKFSLSQYNHPLCKWMRESAENWLWIVENMYALQEEWQYRFGHSSCKKHLSIQKFELMDFPNLPDIPMTPMPKSMPDYCKVIDDDIIPVNSYRNYYRYEKQHLYRWTKRNKPEFLCKE